MKKLIVPLFILIASLNIHCKEEIQISDSSIGIWELRQTSGGIAGNTINYSPGNGNILKFNKDSYQKLVNNKETKSGSYKIIKDISMLTKEQGDRLVFNDETVGLKTFIKIEGHKLYVMMDVYDGVNSVYEKL